MVPPAMSYAEIAREKAAIVERTGLLGEGRASQLMVARYFIEGFGTAEQRAAWLPHLASVAISEPRIGAHPKLLTTRAEKLADGYSIFGEKAWVTNGPLAAVFIVFAR
jgi:acyl-CoA dehydrogenase